MSLASVFPAKFGQRPLFYNQKNPNDSFDQLGGQADDAALLQALYGQGFQVDASLQEDYEFSSEVTDNPVEKGLSVTDNINVKPIGITMVMRHSDTPISLSEVFSGLGTSVGAQLGQQIGPLATQAGGIAGGAFTKMLQGNNGNARTRSKTMYDQFRSLWEKKSVLTVQTGLAIYTNMVIEKFSVNRTPTDGKSIRFTVQMRQIRVVESQVRQVTTPIKSVKTSSQAKPKSDLGRQSAQQVNENKSSAIKLLNFIGAVK